MDTLPPTRGASAISVPARFWMILAVVPITATTYWPSTAALYHAWTDFQALGYTHGLALAVACLLLLLRRAPELSGLPARPWRLAFGALLACSTLWVVFFRASIQDLHVALFPVLIWLSLAAAFGPSVARITAVPAGLLILAVPSWSQFAPPLQWLTVLAMRLSLPLAGVQASISGDLIHIPVGTFAIEDGCSGLHFLLVGLAVAILYGELRDHPIRLRLTHIAVMGVLALLANWVRVFVIIVAGAQTNMRHRLVSVGHYYFGWGVFVLALVLFFWLAAHYEKRLGEFPRWPTEGSRPRARRGEGALPYAVAIATLIAMPALMYGFKALASPPAVPEVRFGAARAGWQGPRAAQGSDWQPIFSGADAHKLEQYVDEGGNIVEVYAAAYATQRQGAELVGSGSSITGLGGLRTVAEQVISSSAGQFREAAVVDSAGRHSLIWFRYQIGARPLVIPLEAQVWYGITSIFQEPVSAVVALRAQCMPSCAEARRRLSQAAAQAPVRIAAATGSTLAAAAPGTLVAFKRTGA